MSKIIGMTFVALLAIILFIWVNNEQRLLDLRDIIDQNQQASKKMQLLNRLIETARSRTRLTAAVIYEADPFLQDEMGLQLDVLATKFTNLRSTLIAMPLSDREKDLLAQQAKSVPVILPAQRLSVELAIKGDNESLKKAKKLLHEVVNPGQNDLVKTLTTIIDYHQSNIDALAIQSHKSYEAAHHRNRKLVIVAFTIGSLLSLLVVIRVRNIQRKVTNARDQLEIAVEMRTQELGESQTMLQTVLDTIPTRVFWKDRSGNYLGCNRLFARDAGELDISDIKGRSDADIFRTKAAIQYAQEDFDVIENSASIVDREEPGVHGHSETWREVTKVPLTNNKGDIVGMLGSYNDITERKRMERIKDNFVSTVSHELRTPLTSIRGSISLLLEGMTSDVTPKMKKLLDLADRNTNRLLTLINDLLDMQKMQAGEMSYQFEPMNLELILHKAIEENTHYATQQRVNYVITETTPVDVRIDEYRMMQVMTNLLSNATKYSSTDSCVEVSLTKEDGFAIVKVIDHGEGIPAKFHDVLFERFTQADSSDTRQKGGTGLGLAITRSIIEQHDGVIGFETEEGVGTTFYFKLPVISADADRSTHEC